MLFCSNVLEEEIYYLRLNGHSTFFKLCEPKVGSTQWCKRANNLRKMYFWHWRRFSIPTICLMSIRPLFPLFDFLCPLNDAHRWIINGNNWKPLFLSGAPSFFENLTSHNVCLNTFSSHSDNGFFSRFSDLSRPFLREIFQDQRFSALFYVLPRGGNRFFSYFLKLLFCGFL